MSMHFFYILDINTSYFKIKIFLLYFYSCYTYRLIDNLFICLERETAYHVLLAQTLSGRYVMGCGIDSRHMAPLHRAGGSHL